MSQSPELGRGNETFKICLTLPKPSRNFRVHPSSNITPVPVASVSDPSISESTSTSTDAVIPDNWTNYRTSFSNLSKRFKTRNKIGTGSATIAVKSTSAFSENIKVTNGSDTKVNRIRSSSNSLRDPGVFASNSQLNAINLKSCLKKRNNSLDKFLCYENSANSMKNGNAAFGFRKFFTVTTTTTLIYLSFVILLLLPSVLCDEKKFGHFSTKEGLKKGIWNELTKDEIASIFGSQHANLDYVNVPNFDIILPIHRKARGKRSLLDGSEPTQRLIEIQGLGRQFNIHVLPNRNLLDPHFVFLKRGDNYSEIMPDSNVQKQLGCFYQGRAEHYPIMITKEEKGNEIVEGPVALSLCNGMKGVILPSSIKRVGKGRSSDDFNDMKDEIGSNNHHYVIHPLPPRFQHKRKANNLNLNNATSTWRKDEHDDDDDEEHHFLFRLASSHAKSFSQPQSVTKKPELESSCGHRHEKYDEDEIKKLTTLRRKRRSPESFQASEARNPRGNDPFDSFWFHQQYQYQNPNQNYQHQRSNLFNPSLPATSSSAVFPSSYWGFRSAEKAGAPFSPGLTGAGNIGLTNSFGRRNYYETDEEIDRDASASMDNKDWSSKRNRDIIVYESTASGEEPDTILPFYTKGRKRNRQSKIMKTGSSWVPTTSGERRGNYSRYNRKGRRDDFYFGSDYKSPLDKIDRRGDSFERNSFSEKKGRFDQSETNSIFPQTSYSQENKEFSQLTIETAVFVDKDLYKHMQSNFPDDTHGEVVRIVLAMINAVQLLYQDPSLGHKVDFVLKRLEVLESDPPGLLRPYDIDRFLTSFCKWQKTENPVSDADPLHWDHAVILTGLDLYVVHQSGKISNQVVGLAPVAGMCTRSSSCTVNEGRHFESVFVISHEIGHNLGMRHDGPQADNDCDPTSHIMSPTLGSGKITWSPCSRKYLDMFLQTSQSKCLLDKGKSEIRLDHDADGRLPGERFDADRQCVLKYGRGSYHATQQPMEDVCRDLHCRREHYTWTSHPALEGTYCGHDMWCRAGKCVRKSAKYPFTSPSNSDEELGDLSSNHLFGGETAAHSVQKAVDGQWGQWSLFTECSSACLHSDDGSLNKGSTGIRLAARRCDSPRPENGGRQCSGPDRRYKSCSSSKASNICAANPTRITVSQYANDVCNRAAKVDNDLTGIGFMMSTNDAERACNVWCETIDNGVPRSRGWSFPDGTSCEVASKSKSQNYCVAGKCQDFTCNPYSYYALSDEDCTFSNEVTPQSSWYTSSSLGSDSVGKFPERIRNKDGWSDWESHSECKLPCLAPAKGLELVKRRCSSKDDDNENSCSGLALSVRLCKPDKTTITRTGCSRLQTPFEYATKVCSKYAEKIPGLSGIGMQLSPTKEDKDRPCRIGCQDVSITYRFYMVNGEDGWFPAGTDCSRGDPDKKAFCITGKCVDFGNDDTPIYRVNTKLLGKIESLFQQRRKRQATYNIMEPLRVPSSMDESSLRELVYKFSRETGNFPSITAASSRRQSVDFTRPVVANYLENHSSSRRPDARTISASGYSHHSFPKSSNSERLTLDSSSFYSRSGEGHHYQRQPYSRRYSSHEDNFNSNKYRQRGRALNFDDRKNSNDDVEKVSRMEFSETSNSNSLLDGPVEGSYYEWRKIVSDCSVSCGKGIQEVIVQCVSGDTVVSDSLCSSRPRPGYSSYVDCHRIACSSARKSEGHIWNWLQSILPKNSSEPIK